MPQMPQMPQMPSKHFGQIMNSGFLKQNAGQHGQQGPGQEHGHGQGHGHGPPPQDGQNGGDQDKN